MKTTFKKTLSLLFVLMLLVSVFAMTAAATEAEEPELADVEIAQVVRPGEEVVLTPRGSDEPVVVMSGTEPAKEGTAENADGVANSAGDASASGGNTWIIIVAAAAVVAVIAVVVVKSKKK